MTDRHCSMAILVKIACSVVAVGLAIVAADSIWMFLLFLLLIARSHFASVWRTICVLYIKVLVGVKYEDSLPTENG